MKEKPTSGGGSSKTFTSGGGAAAAGSPAPCGAVAVTENIDLSKSTTGLDKKNVSALNCRYFLTHQFKHMFWVLKRTVSLRRSF